MKASLKNDIIFFLCGAVISAASAAVAYSFRPPNVEIEIADAESSVDAETEKQTVYGIIESWEAPSEAQLSWVASSEGFIPFDCAMDTNVQLFTYYMCQAWNISYPLVMSIICHESGFDAGAISADGENIGLMQISRSNFDWLSENAKITDLQNPYDNVRAGLYVLRLLFEQYEDTELVLMAYNLGEGGASVLWSHGIYQTTYSQTIIKTAYEYAERIAEAKK